MIRKAAISIIVFAICLLTVGSGADDQPEKRVMNFLAVMDLKCGEGIKKEQCAFLTNVVIDALVKSKKYTVIDRANRDKILGEAGFQMSACVDESCTVEAGRILGVGKIITGSVDLIDKTYFLNIQLINVETAAVEASATKLCECDFKELTDTIRYAARNLVAEPQVHLPATTTPSGAKGGEMVCVPAGEFMMGSDNGNSDEKPIHRVYLDEFYIDKYEVTNAQYNKCVSAGACGQNTKYDGFTDPQQPVVGVTWHQADTYCKWVGKRLPTEAEWEKAARGTGEGIDCSKANYYKCGHKKTKPVGSYPFGAGPYGAMDMAGNVWEWCSDRYDEKYYSKNPNRNPTGPASGKYHVLHGGSWNAYPNLLRSSNRTRNDPDNLSSSNGFRCAGTR